MKRGHEVLIMEPEKNRPLGDLGWIHLAQDRMGSCEHSN